jgi:hypothetical protein
MNKSPLFHLAFPVTDLAQTRRFYGEILGCCEGRSAGRWVDFDFFGHQLSAHLIDENTGAMPTNPVDGEAVPVRHFGVILEMQDWRQLAARLEQRGVKFLIKPDIRFRNQVGEQATMFLLDPSGNALEFKSFTDPAQIFAR